MKTTVTIITIDLALNTHTLSEETAEANPVPHAAKDVCSFVLTPEVTLALTVQYIAWKNESTQNLSSQLILPASHNNA